MKSFGMGLLCAVGGYLISAFIGYWLSKWFSSNTHDRSLEVSMTSMFIFGPCGAVIGFIIGISVSR
jgi:F0F1-type ATP synthase membrane subunit c/vacuolar-type H+-ATPase subunit K